MRRVTTLVSALLAGALVLTGCGGGDDNKQRGHDPRGDGQQQRPRQRRSRSGWPTTSAAAATSPSTTAAAAGLDKAKPTSSASRPRRPRPATARPTPPRRSVCACSPTRATTRSSRSASPTPARSRKVAKELPDTKFAIIDDAAAMGDNIANLLFAEEQGSFLVGAAAALKSKTGNVGFVGGVEVAADQEVRGGLHGRRQGGQPGHQGPGQVPHPAAGLLRLQ